MWNFFRLENEHLNNCGQFRAVRDISITPLTTNDQTLLEQMMDEDDGVNNRRKTKQQQKGLSSRWGDTVENTVETLLYKPVERL